MDLDHLAVSGASVEEAAAHVEEALGVAMQPGGRHDIFGTHNRLLGLRGGLYLEAIAVDPEAPEPGRPRWFDLDRFAGNARLTNWICRAERLEVALDRAPQGSGVPLDLARGGLRWRMAVPDDGVLPFGGAYPALIEWQAGGHPSRALADSGCELIRLVVAHPEAASLAEILNGDLADPRVVVECGPMVEFRAEFDTPHGRRALQ